MTKKVNTGGVSNLATALANAGVAASAPTADAQQPAPVQPASPQAAIDATTLATEIDVAKKVWEHAKAAGISKDQFLTFCEIDAEKFAFFKTHKKEIFGSKKQQLEEAAAAVMSKPSDITRSKSKSKSKSTKPHVSLPRSDVSRMLDVLLKQHKQINAKK